MKLTKEQKQAANENMQFYNELLKKAIEDPNFTEDSLREAIFQRFYYSEGFFFIATKFREIGRELGYTFPSSDGSIPLDHEKTVAIFKKMVERMQAVYDAMNVSEKVEE